ncbi:DUF6879 family protein [Streptomyces drozdowiczii]
MRFEHACTPRNLSAGEEVRWLPRDQAVGLLGTPAGVPGRRRAVAVPERAVRRRPW